jgi:hypothetical protein
VLAGSAGGLDAAALSGAYSLKNSSRGFSRIFADLRGFGLFVLWDYLFFGSAKIRKDRRRSAVQDLHE